MDETQLKSEVKELERAIKATGKEADALEERLREELVPEFKELVRYARRRGHTWLNRGLLFGPPRTDEALIDFLVELATLQEVREFEEDHIEPLKDQLSDKRRELRKLTEKRKADEAMKEGQEANEWSKRVRRKRR